MTASILIVDDESSIRLLLARILQGQGYHCQQAENVSAAQNILNQGHIDLLLTDVNMPGGSGLDLTRYVKEKHPRTAVVMVTVIDNLEQATEILAIGIYGYIIKPFSSNLVLITVANALRRHQLEQQELDNIRILEERVAERTKNLTEQYHLHQVLLDAIPLPIYYKNLDGKYLGCNQAFAKAVNIPQHQVIGKTVHDMHPQDIAGLLWDRDQKLFASGDIQVYEQSFSNQNGTTTIGMIHKAPLRDLTGKVSGLIGIRLDITELKHTEQALRHSQEKMRSIMDNLQIGVVMISPQFAILELNQQMKHWFSGAEKPGISECFKLFPGKMAQCESCPVEEVFRTAKATEVLRSLDTISGTRVFRILASPIHQDTGEIVAVLELFEDVTESLAAERELRQAQKLEAVGQLAAGIAHEINTPIQYVGDNINFLRDACTDLFSVMDKYQQLVMRSKGNPELQQLIAAIETAENSVDIPYLTEEIPNTVAQSLDGVNRVTKIVQAMREFSHPGTSEKSFIDINRALESTLIISRNEWKYVADTATELAEDLPPLLCLPGEINQVFLNIIVNAAHAISDCTDAGNSGKGLITVTTAVQGDTIEVRISDTGRGIPEKIRDRVFDPFFTTKRVGKGTGQGLAIARSVVVDKHQGSISFDTALGVGTTFIIRLPVSSVDQT